MMYCKDKKFHDYRLVRTPFLRKEVYSCKTCVSTLSTEKYREWFKKKLRFIDVLNERRNNSNFWSI